MGKVVGVVLVDEVVELVVELDEAVMVVLPDTETEPLADAVLEPDAVGADVAAEGDMKEEEVSMKAMIPASMDTRAQLNLPLPFDPDALPLPDACVAEAVFCAETRAQSAINASARYCRATFR